MFRACLRSLFQSGVPKGARAGPPLSPAMPLPHCRDAFRFRASLYSIKACRMDDVDRFVGRGHAPYIAGA